jgi:hypothetical protein
MKGAAMKKLFAAMVFCLFAAGCDDPVLTDPGYTKPPILLSPENGATNVELCPTFRWKNGCVMCTIELSLNPDFNPVLKSGLSFTDTLKFADSLGRAGTFYWRAQARCGEWGSSGWSAANRFRTVE